jgi:tetratricopeptide (TPR) repeat protein
MHLAALGSFTQSEPHLAAAYRLWRQDVETCVGYGNLLRALGRGADAETVLRQALLADPNSVDAIVGLAACIVDAKPEEALALVEGKDGAWPDLLLVRGLAKLRLGRHGAASADLRRAADGAPPGAAGVPFVSRAAEALTLCGDAEGARSAAARWTGSDRAGGHASPRAALCLAIAEAALGRLDAALAVLDAAPPCDTDPPELRVRAALVRAALCLDAGRADAAAPHLACLAGLADERFERCAARRLTGEATERDLAAWAATAELANDVEWVESLAAAARGDAALARRRREACATASSPPGEFPGLLARIAAGPR